MTVVYFSQKVLPNLSNPNQLQMRMCCYSLQDSLDYLCVPIPSKPKAILVSICIQTNILTGSLGFTHESTSPSEIQRWQGPS